MNSIKYRQIFGSYWILIAGATLALFAMLHWLADRSYHPIELFYEIAFFVCVFNLVAAYKENRSQIFLGRISMLAIMFWPICLMYVNLKQTDPTITTQVTMASFFLLGALAIPVSQAGELIVYLILKSYGFASSHDLSSLLSMTQYFIFETMRYVFWIFIQWVYFVPLIMRWLRRKIVANPKA